MPSSTQYNHLHEGVAVYHMSVACFFILDLILKNQSFSPKISLSVLSKKHEHSQKDRFREPPGDIVEGFVPTNAVVTVMKWT